MAMLTYIPFGFVNNTGPRRWPRNWRKQLQSMRMKIHAADFASDSAIKGMISTRKYEKNGNEHDFGHDLERYDETFFHFQ